MRFLLALLIVLPSNVVLAQTDLTGSGGAPSSTITAPNVTATGTTKPPDRAASPTERLDPDERTRSERESDRIDTSICKGCLSE